MFLLLFWLFLSALQENYGFYFHIQMWKGDWATCTYYDPEHSTSHGVKECQWVSIVKGFPNYEFEITMEKNDSLRLYYNQSNEICTRLDYGFSDQYLNFDTENFLSKHSCGTKDGQLTVNDYLHKFRYTDPFYLSNFQVTGVYFHDQTIMDAIYTPKNAPNKNESTDDVIFTYYSSPWIGKQKHLFASKRGFTINHRWCNFRQITEDIKEFTIFASNSTVLNDGYELINFSEEYSRKYMGIIRADELKITHEKYSRNVFNIRYKIFRYPCPQNFKHNAPQVDLSEITPYGCIHQNLSTWLIPKIVHSSCPTIHILGTDLPKNFILFKLTIKNLEYKLRINASTEMNQIHSDPTFSFKFGIFYGLHDSHKYLVVFCDDLLMSYEAIKLDDVIDYNREHKKVYHKIMVIILVMVLIFLSIVGIVLRIKYKCLILSHSPDNQPLAPRDEEDNAEENPDQEVEIFPAYDESLNNDRRPSLSSRIAQSFPRTGRISLVQLEPMRYETLVNDST